MADAISRIRQLVEARRPALVVTANVDHLVRACHDDEYTAIVQRADLVLADGQPLVWLSRLMKASLPERVAGSDLFPLLCGRAAEHGWRVFFLGGVPGSAAAARDVLVARYPKLQVVGVYCPPMGFEHDRAEQQRALEAVRSARPQLVFVGLGSPKQERWIDAYRGQYGPAVGIGVGISFSFTAGQVKRASRWMRRIGLKWLHRVIMEPRRLTRRYFLESWGLIPIVAKDLRRAWLKPKDNQRIALEPMK